MDGPSSCPSTPRWNAERPFLTGRFHQEAALASGLAESKGKYADAFSSGFDNPIGSYSPSVQELIVIDDLLYALTGIGGRYISIQRVRGKEDSICFQVDASMDLALQESSKRIFPLCESYYLINQFVESRSQFKKGLLNHAFAAALRALLLDYQAMVAQLEHQFRLGRLSMQGLWFYCQNDWTIWEIDFRMSKRVLGKDVGNFLPGDIFPSLGVSGSHFGKTLCSSHFLLLEEHLFWFFKGPCA